jgi:uncharacterized membrane protein (GlpM family)
VLIDASLLAKAAWSAAIVLALSALAERVSPRVAGILAGAPHGTLLVYFFVGHDLGPDYVVQSTPHGVAAFTATIAFVIAYQQVSARVRRGAIAASAIGASVVFFLVAWVLAQVPFTLPGATVLTVAVSAGAVWLMRRIANVPVTHPVRFTLRLLALRAGLAALFVVSAIALASALGPRWAGLMVGYPMTMLPTLLIVHHTYGAPSTHAMIRNIPLGVGSIVVYILAVSVAFPALGVTLGTLASLAAAMVYLSAAMCLGPGRRTASAGPARR